MIRPFAAMLHRPEVGGCSGDLGPVEHGCEGADHRASAGDDVIEGLQLSGGHLLPLLDHPDTRHRSSLF
jgi:hypothetical protein